MIRKALIYMGVERELAFYAVRAHLSNAKIDGYWIHSTSISATENETCCVRVMLCDTENSENRHDYTMDSISKLLNVEPEIIER